MQRVAVFVDEFNLYHALLKFRDDRVKWLSLNDLSKRLVRPQSERIVAIYYFSALAKWLVASSSRHREYIKALEATGVIPILGHFKEKDRGCRSCGATWKGHEEKETDVNIALHMLRGAYKDEFDKALLISRDSDLVPAVAMIRNDFADKEVIAVAPPLMGHSNDLLRVCSSKRKITPQHILSSLLPAIVLDSSGQVVASRPIPYT